MVFYFWGGIALCVALGISVRLYWDNQEKEREIQVLQGIDTQSKKYSKPMSKREGEHYLWGNEFLDDDQASLHFLAVGSTGSGKTINILLLMKTVVARINEEGSGIRALAYDSKTDMLSTIRGMGAAEEDILVGNPFDERRVAWAIAKDVRTKAEATDMAAILIPIDGKDTFFNLAARRWLIGIITAFQINAPGKWTLRDLILATRTARSLFSVWSSCIHTGHLMDDFKVEKTAENIRQPLSNYMDQLETVAASWEGAARSFVIQDWLTQQKVLVLGNSPKAKEPIKRINQLLFTSISKAVLSRPGRDKAKHWFFLDELRELGVLDYLDDMMIVGRSKGASMVLGFQDIYGMYREYGKERAQEIIGCTQNFTLLRINATQPETQKWASEVAGQLRYREIKKSTSESQTSGPQGTTTGTNTSYELRTDHIYIPSYFSQKLPQTNFENGMEGVYYTKGSLYEQPFPGEVLFTEKGNTNRVPEPTSDFEDHVPIDDGDLLLEPWGEQDYKRLGISDMSNAAP